MNTYWSTYVQSSEELYRSRELRFHEGNKELWLNALQVKDGMQILEVGCGGGIFCHRIKTYLPNTKVVGLDRDSGHVEYAKQKSKELGIDCTFINGDAVALPFQNDAFDLCFSHTVFDFCEPDAYIREQQRVLKPDGKMVIANVYGGYNSEQWKPTDTDEEKALFDRLWSQAEKNELSQIKKNGVGIQHYPKYLRQAGFKNIKIEAIAVVPYSPDSGDVSRDAARRQINENRLSEISSVHKARLMAPSALTDTEYTQLVAMIHRRYDRRIEQYEQGNEVWDFSISTIFMASGVKQ